jgi:hypothetical protein
MNIIKKMYDKLVEIFNYIMCGMVLYCFHSSYTDSPPTPEKSDKIIKLLEKNPNEKIYLKNVEFLNNALKNLSEYKTVVKVRDSHTQTNIELEINTSSSQTNSIELCSSYSQTNVNKSPVSPVYPIIDEDYMSMIGAEFRMDNIGFIETDESDLSDIEIDEELIASNNNMSSSNISLI